MDSISATEFQQHCFRIPDELGPDGLLITRNDRAVARLMRVGPQAHLMGLLRDELWVREGDNLFSTGEWVSDEWDEPNFDD